MPRSDDYKLMFGPLVSSMESVVYDLTLTSGERDYKPFIKHVPVDERPRVIYEALSGMKHVVATDHTRYEAHFCSEFQRACEFVVYEYLTQNNEYGRKMIKRLKVLQTEDHEYLGYGWSLKTKAKRMSGDLTTSLGNGISNLLIMLFTARELGVEVRGFVEGDDGLFGVGATSDEFRMPGPDYFERYGMEVKIDFVDDPCRASFCGNVFSPGSFRNVTNPIDKILRMGWNLDSTYFDAGDQVRCSIQHAAALSLAAGYVGCPILSAYARMLLRLIGHVKPRFGDAKHTYTWDELWEMGGPSWRTVTRDRVMSTVRDVDRELVEEEYGIPIKDQVEIESFFDNNTERVWYCAAFARHVPKIHFDQFSKQLCPRSVDQLVYPTLN